ncbi:MAG: polymer-forming cytoskeletal protein [Verrucomicrobiae bacterium]|nr:polymer-forming cytoskeletal protein [Verrucomicrobiae bacterium]
MFFTKRKHIEVVCPSCGAHQLEPSGCISTFCKSCQAHFKLNKALKPKRNPNRPSVSERALHCFECRSLLHVAPEALSTICNVCGHCVDLNDYTINSRVARNFQTKGSLLIGEKGILSAEKIIVGHAEIRGQLRVGEFVCEGSVELFPTASVQGNIRAQLLKVMESAQLKIKDHIEVESVHILGKISGRLVCKGLALIGPTGAFEGELLTQRLRMEAGGLLSGAINTLPPVEDSSQTAAAVLDSPHTDPENSRRPVAN